MALGDDDVRELTTLEESLWRRETRFDLEHMRRVLADDFFEFGRSGRIHSLADCLAVPARDIPARLPLRDLAVHEVGDGVALVTYVSEVGDDEQEVANRSSLWLRTGAGWKLRFHQGTPITAGS